MLYLIDTMTPKEYIFFIIGIGYLVFFNSLLNGFVWDDNFQIVNNYAVHAGDLFYYFTHTIGPYYRPLMLALFTFIFQLFGHNALFYHFIQITIHIINTVLIFWLFLYFSKRVFISFITAVLFLIHPMNTEPVNYIANTQDVLFVFFGLTTLYITSNKTFYRYSDGIAAGFLFFGLLAKETGALFVLMYTLFIVFIKKERKIQPIIWVCVAGSSYLLMRFLLVGPIRPTNFNFIPPNTIMALPLQERLLSIPKIIHFYITTFLFPADLTAKYWYVQAITLPDFILPLLFDLIFWGCLLVVGIFLTRKSRRSAQSYWFFLIWFCFGLGFHLQILPLDKTTSDRWFYFPMIGLLGMITVVLQHIQLKPATRKTKALIVLVSIVYAALALRTVIRNTDWYNDLSLFSHDISSMENVGDIQFNYGTALLNDGQYDEATIHLQKASTLVPNSFQVWHNLGVVYLHTNRIEKAGECFKRAILLNKNATMSYNAYILMLILQNKPQEAKKIAQKALQIWPDNPPLLRMYGLAVYKLNDINLAKESFQKSFLLIPDPITLYYLQQLEQNLPLKLKEL